MKLTHKVELSFIIENLQSLRLTESATADAIGKAIADIEKTKDKKTAKNLGNIIRNVIEDLHAIKSALPRKMQNTVSGDIAKLKAIMKSLKLSVPSSFDKINPKT